MCIVEDHPRGVETSEQRRVAPHAGTWGNTLLRGNLTRALGEMLGAQQLASNWTGEQVLAPVRVSREQTRQERWDSYGRNRTVSGEVKAWLKPED
ncbi:MAG TPA: hypothetical protein VJ596_05010 [Gemmatimonadaceae bacterium]|nr:hypothetical protein [Gemmatimonadaceae bacterium]